MTEQQEPLAKPEPSAVSDVISKTKDNPGAVTKDCKSRSGAVLGSIAILLALGLAAGLYLHGHKNAVAQQAELSQLKQQLAETMNKLDQGSSKDAEQLASLGQSQRQLQDALNSLQGRVLDLDAKRPNDWMLAESEYLVRMAGRKLWLEHDVASAITLLGNADERIRALNDPSLMPVRKALAEDITQLKGMPRVDREGLTLKLAALSNQIEQLPLSAVNMPEAAKPEADQTVSTSASDWQSNLKKNWINFTEHFITIRRRDGAVEALLSPQQEIFLRENIKTKLLQAQLAVYREQQALYEDSLGNAQRWLTQYFDADSSATRNMQAELEKLKGERIQFEYPDQFKTQSMLERALNERLQRILASN